MKELIPPPPPELVGPKAEIHKCRGCGEKIYYLKEARLGYVQPINVEVSEDGDIHINPNIGRFVFVTAEDRPIMREEHGLHHNHYEVCPNRKGTQKTKTPLGKGIKRELRRKREEAMDMVKEFADALGLDIGEE